jgi:Dyp-type peroxidase family
MELEEQLELDDIQGAIIPGFKKDYAALLYLRINDRAGCKRWLADRAKEVARADEVLAFNRLFRTMRKRRDGETGLPSAVWLSISFSCEGLSILRSDAEIASAFAFSDAFQDGMSKSVLHDPPPSAWTIGGTPETMPHILLVVAADDPKQLAAEIKRLKGTLGAGRGRRNRPLTLMAGPQLGATLPAPLTGHEHFGFKDGISQPAVRGLASATPGDFLDDRRLAPSDPAADLFAEPGRVLVWPGQFVLGYQRQNRLQLTAPSPPFQVTVPWQRNGSFLVYRRLQQKTHLFWQFCTEQATRLSKPDRVMSAVQFATLLVGRWPSGAPLVRAVTADDPALGADDNANNQFRFSEATPPVTLANGEVAGAAFPAPMPDPNGLVCPFAAHIRKVNPRDDPSDTSGERQTKIRLMLRRGIPYGEVSKEPRPLQDDRVDRGLLFMSYQASLDAQFEFVSKTWVNRANSPHDSDPPTGLDPLIGESAGARFVRIAGDDQQIDLPAEPWVVMTGGGYFFTPSISALSGALVE